MMKFVFLALLVPAFLAETDTVSDKRGESEPTKCMDAYKHMHECFKKPRELQLQHSEADDNLPTDRAYTRMMTPVLKEAVTCVKNSPSIGCKEVSLPVYFIQASVFLGEHLYGDAFDCVDGTPHEESLLACFRANGPDQPSVEDSDKMRSECVLTTLEDSKCSVEDKKEFLRSAKVTNVIYAKIRKLVSGAGDDHLDEVFNADNY